MWPATVRAAQRRAAQLAGVGDVGEKQRLHARRQRAAGQADCSTSTSCSCATCDRLALWMGIDEHGVFSVGWFRLACTRRPGGDVAGEGACCPTSRCAACGCQCCWCQLHCGDGVCKLCCGGAGDGRAVGKDFKTCTLPTTSIQDAYILVSFPPLPLVRPTHVHTYHIH